MRLTIAAVGRLRAGPEKSLVDDYAARTTATGRPIALGPLDIVEIDDRKARDKATQSTRLKDAATKADAVICLDERGKVIDSPAFSRMLTTLRDQGNQETCFLIGGADGHDRALRQAATHVLSFGPMVWPHMLVRVMLAEQIYRAISIAAGTPYHRV